MNEPIVSRGRSLIACLPLALLLACGSPSSGGGGGTGGQASGSGGASGTGTGGTSGSGGSNGSGGASVGSGGAAVVDAASDVVTVGDGGGDTGVPGGLRGTQGDPTAEGDGRFQQPGPYTAPPETLARTAGIPQGKVTAKVIYASPAVYPGLKFQYSIYVPAQYQAGKRAALMIFLDAPHYDGTDNYGFNVPVTFDNLIAKGDLPVTIAVFVDPGTATGIYRRGTTDAQTYREPQYNTANDRQTRLILDELLKDEVLPKYDIVQDPDGWAIGGHSSGAVAGFMIAWNRPETIHKVLTHNCSFPPTQVFPARIASTTPAKPLRIYLTSGTNDLPGWFASNDQAATDLMGKGYHYRYLRGTGTHDPPVQALADFPNALRWLWRGYSLPWYR